jgi:uncharacterized surface protein with fasciclin (FAS1) repeats
LLGPVTVLAQAAVAPTPPATTPPAATTPPSPNVVPSGDLVATLKSSGHFTILVKALDAANLSAVLAATPDLTIFAPTDQAFQALPPAELAALMAPKNAPVLQKVLTYHVVHLNLDSSKFKGAKGPVASVESSQLQLDGSGDPLKVNDADIIQADVHATNGYIQVVDKVLVPSDVALPTASAETGSPPPTGR